MGCTWRGYGGCIGQDKGPSHTAHSHHAPRAETPVLCIRAHAHALPRLRVVPGVMGKTGAADAVLCADSWWARARACREVRRWGTVTAGRANQNMV
jgi:hypothetical protein